MMDGISAIDEVVSEYHVWLSSDLFPFPKMKVKVLLRSGGDFLAIANASVRNVVTGLPEWIAGLGGSATEALNDLLVRFVAEARMNRPPDGFKEMDFEWSAPDDF